MPARIQGLVRTQRHHPMVAAFIHVHHEIAEASSGLGCSPGFIKHDVFGVEKGKLLRKLLVNGYELMTRLKIFNST